MSTPKRANPDVEHELATTFGVDDLDEFLVTSETQALIVIDNDRIVFERYANGAERATMLTSFSVAKSFDSALIGIAIDEGLLGVDDPITVHLPELAGNDPDVSEITSAVGLGKGLSGTLCIGRDLRVRG